jgi:hypothetical protein
MESEGAILGAREGEWVLSIVLHVHLFKSAAIALGLCKDRHDSGRRIT